MGDRFTWSRGVAYWLGGVAALGLIAVVAGGRDGLFPGGWLLFLGAGMVWVGGIIGSARTGSWFTWQEKVTPTHFEAVTGLTGAVLASCPLVVLAIRLMLLYFNQKGA
jgi:hypothetical protein